MPKMYAVIMVRGTEKLNSEKKNTLKSLNLTKPNHCILLEEKDSVEGMLTKVKDHITWGEVSPEVAEKLAKIKNAKKISKSKTLIRLHPPSKGFERKGLKMAFNQGGVLGYRGEKINALIEKMITPEKSAMKKM